MKKLIPINQEELLLDTPLPQDVYDRNGILLLKKGYIIKTQKQLHSLFQRGASFLVSEPISKPAPPAPPPQADARHPVERIEDIYAELTRLFSRPQGVIGFPLKILELVKKIQKACSLNTDAVLGAILLMKESRYTVIHPLHCALLCHLLLEAWDPPPEGHSSLLAAALTMNIAMIDLQNELFHKKGGLPEATKKQIATHPQRGVVMLRSLGVSDETWLQIVYGHHEFMDGSGYPQGLQGEAIPLLTRILTLTDIYSVKLFSRAYRLPLPADVAAREIITGSRGQSLDQELAKVLVKIVGIFPPGSFVRLINGEIAVVTHRGKKIHHPIVHSVIKEDGVPFPKPIRRDCSRENFSIVYSIPAQKIAIELDKKLLWPG